MRNTRTGELRTVFMIISRIEAAPVILLDFFSKILGISCAS